jgi:hypothetical protein
MNSKTNDKVRNSVDHATDKAVYKAVSRPVYRGAGRVLLSPAVLSGAWAVDLALATGALNPPLVWSIGDSGTWDVEKETEDAVETRARHINLDKFLKGLEPR